MKKILIAVDDSETSVRAAHCAHELFGDDAQYTVLCVATSIPVMWGEFAMGSGMAYPLAVAPGGYTGGVPFVVSDPVTHDDSGKVVTAVDIAEKTAIDVATDAAIPSPRTIGEQGDPALAIVEAARKYEVDVIVVGSHDRGWFSRLLSGSVATAVVRSSEIPVLVAR